MDDNIFELTRQIGENLKAKGLKLATAESCTGGGIAQTLTEVPGSSVWFDRGFVTYSNRSKVDMLGVDPQTLAQYGAVSAEVAQQMAAGAIAKSEAELAIAVTGIAGPGGGSLEKPVGTVYVAWQNKYQPAIVDKFQLSGNRHQIRAQTIQKALEGLLSIY